jgi:hypothetical protein
VLFASCVGIAAFCVATFRIVTTIAIASITD